MKGRQSAPAPREEAKEAKVPTELKNSRKERATRFKNMLKQFRINQSQQDDAEMKARMEKVTGQPFSLAPSTVKATTTVKATLYYSPTAPTLSPREQAYNAWRAERTRRRDSLAGYVNRF